LANVSQNEMLRLVVALPEGHVKGFVGGRENVIWVKGEEEAVELVPPGGCRGGWA